MKPDTTYHSDGTVTYWSVYLSQWIRHATQVPDRELSAMGRDERDQVIEHLRNASVHHA